MPDLRGRLQIALGGRFRIIRELTGGGMSRVFLAHEEGLERETVVKVLAPNLVAPAVVARFRNEVLQTARLQHPNIVPVLDVGDIDDERGHRLPYYVMPYVRGESLRSRLLDEGSLSIPMTVRVLRCVLDALAYAHKHGVIHRDIKPENIFLSGSTAVLADFGVAYAIAGPGSGERVTSPGIVVGTPAYMAPEQLAGDELLDARADLYALGVLAFEMLAGGPPWSAPTPAGMLAVRARDQRTSLRMLRPDAPAQLIALIEQSLSWDSDRRPASAMEALRRLEAIPLTLGTPVSRAVSSAKEPHRERRKWYLRVGAVAGIAVVAALLLSPWIGDDGTELFADTRLTVLFPEIAAGGEEVLPLREQLYHNLVAELGPLSGLTLTNRVGVARMAESGLPATQVADSLRAAGVDSVLVLQAIQATDGSYLLSVELRRLLAGEREHLAGPLSLQTLAPLPPDSARKLTRLLAGQVAVRLGLTSSRTDVPETLLLDAWMAWASGHEAMLRRTPEGLAEAIQYLERAISLDPSYAQARAELANVLALNSFYRYRTNRSPYEQVTRALRLANEAIRLQPAVADAYCARALLGVHAGAPILFVEENYLTAERLRPENPSCGAWRTGVLALQGRYEEALADVEEQIANEPRLAPTRLTSALYSLAAGRYPSVVRRAREARELQPGIPLATGLEIWGRVLLGGQEMAGCTSLEAGPYLGARAVCLERTLGASAAQHVADSLFEQTMADDNDPTFELSLYTSERAIYHAAREEMEAARQWLQQSFAESPMGIDYRFMRSGLFSPELQAFADTLRTRTWQLVSEAAARDEDRGADSTPSGVPVP